MGATDEFLINNQAYAVRFDSGHLPTPPRKQVAVVTCMDSRMDIFALLGLKNGEAHIIRNAGGVVTDDVIRSLAISQRLLDTEEIILMHHTNCGMQAITDDEFADTVQEETGVRPPWPVEAFSDLDENVRESIARVKASPFIPKKDSVRGFVYEVETGRLREVV